MEYLDKDRYEKMQNRRLMEARTTVTMVINFFTVEHTGPGGMVQHAVTLVNDKPQAEGWIISHSTTDITMEEIENFSVFKQTT